MPASTVVVPETVQTPFMHPEPSGQTLPHTLQLRWSKKRFVQIGFCPL